MKPIALVAAAVAVNLLALLAYDVYVAQPRLAAVPAAAASPAAVVAPPATPDAAPEPVAAPAAPVAAPVAAPANASDATRTALLMEAVQRATMSRAAVAEFRMSNAAWPRTLEDAGLPPGDELGGPVGLFAMGQDGAVEIRLAAPLSGTTLRLVPTEDGAGIQWACRYTGPGPVEDVLTRCTRE